MSRFAEMVKKNRALRKGWIVLSASLLIASLYIGMRVYSAGRQGEEHYAAEHQEEDHHHEAQGGAAAEGEIVLSEEAEANLGLKLEEVGIQTVERVIKINGLMKAQPNRRAFVSSLVEGKVTRIYVDLGDRVKKGQKLIDILSLQFGEQQTSLIQSSAEMERRRAELERVRSLSEQNIAAKKRLIEAETEYRKSLSEVEILKTKLLAAGMTEAELEKVIRGGSVTPLYSIRSPIAGSIVKRDVTLGASVELTDVLFEILDLSHVWIEGDVLENDLSKIKAGQRVRARLAAYPDETFSGTIRYIDDVLDPGKRAAHLRVAVENPDRQLKPGMFAELAVVVDVAREAIAVPKEAVLGDGPERYVFVQNGNAFQRQPVVLGMRGDRYIEITDGLYPGDVVVVKGGYELSFVPPSGAETVPVVDESKPHTH